MEIKNYRSLSKEYREGCHTLASMSKKEKETAAGFKLIKKLSQLKKDMDKIANEMSANRIPSYARD